MNLDIEKIKCVMIDERENLPNLCKNGLIFQKIYRIEDFISPIVMITYRKVSGIYIQTLLFGCSMLIILILVESTITLGQLDMAENKPPVIVVPSSISAEINHAVVINTSISDPDGNIKSSLLFSNIYPNRLQRS